MRIFVVLLFGLSFLSCKSQLIEEIEKCSNSKTDASVHKIEDNRESYFLRAFTEIENLMLKETALNRIDKISYLSMLSHFEQKIYPDKSKNKDLKGKFAKILEQNNISPVSIIGEANNFIFNCFYKQDTGSIKIRDDSLADYIDKAQYIYANVGLYYSLEEMIDLIGVIPDKLFENVVFRVPINMMIYENLNHYAR